MTASQPFFLFCHMMNVFIIIRSFTQGVYNRLPFFAHCTRDFIALVMDEPQLPHAGVAQAQAAIDAENHAAPPQEQPQAQSEVQVPPNTETVPAPTSLLKVIFFFFFERSFGVYERCIQCCLSPRHSFVRREGQSVSPYFVAFSLSPRVFPLDRRE